jgi:hypothetical protein
MKISELIENLNRIAKEKGDINVVDTFYAPIEKVIIYVDVLDEEEVAMIVS